MTTKRTGTIQPWTDADGRQRFRARVRLGDGSRPWISLPEGTTEDAARALAAELQAKENAHGLLLAARQERQRDEARTAGLAIDGERADAWHERFRKSRGEGDTSNARYAWRKWVSPKIGHMPMALVSTADIETVRDALDVAVAAYEREGKGPDRITGKTALEVWSTVTTAFKAACQAKDRSFRVRSDNPCTGVLAPERGEPRRKPWIYPREFSALVACEAVPLEWRELYAVAVGLYLRPGELVELRWKDVDLDVGIVSISRAFDWRANEVKAPKTRNGIRSVPIPPILVQLLRRMAVGRGREDKVVPVLERTGKLESAPTLRKHLLAAGVDHPRLTQDTATHMPVGFRSFRDTGITWLAIEGVDAVKMQRRAGHDAISTTLGYVKAAEDIGGAGGEPFPPLPAALVAGDRPTDRSSDLSETSDSATLAVAPPGLEPGRPSGPEILNLLRIPFRQGARHCATQFSAPREN